MSVVAEIIYGPASDSGDFTPVLGEGALVVEINCPVVGGFLRDECSVLVWAGSDSKSEKAVFLLKLRLVDQPVVVVGFAGLGVQEHDGLRHGAWYGRSVDPTMW